MTLLKVFCATVLLLVMVLPTLIIVRMLYQFFCDEEGPLYGFLYTSTEPVLYPVRSVLLRTEFFSSLPVDFSGVFAIMLLMLVRTLLTLV